MQTTIAKPHGEHGQALQSRLGSLRQRLLGFGAASALLWGAIGVVAVLAAAVWLDLLWELAPAARITALVIAAAAGLLVAAAYLASIFRTAGDTALARRLDRAAESGGQIVTGWELAHGVGPSQVAAAPSGPQGMLSAAFAQISVRRASQLASKIPAKAAVSGDALRRSCTAAGTVAAAVAILFLIFPRALATQWDRFAHPLADVPPFSRMEFDVQPGDAKVVYGQGLDIFVTVRGAGAAGADKVQLVIVPLAAAGDAKAAQGETLPMFAESGGRWRAVLTRVTESSLYYAESHGARSRHYRIDVVTVPKIEKVQLRITPPAYTHRAAYEGPLPKEGIAGLPGTKVEFTATSNRPLSGGQVVVTPSGKKPAATKQSFPLLPAGAGATEVSGSLTITQSGTFQLIVEDVAGQPSTEPFGGTITLLLDQRPFVRLLRPRMMSLATPESVIPVEVAAEDDCGVSKVQLFRSLNDSRDLPQDLPIGSTGPTSVRRSVDLPLAQYGLTPGDTIKLFARVEDNDPAGAKGAESPVATIRIISQEDLERMVRRREGLNEFLSKYRQAQRHLEALRSEASRLKKRLAQEPKDGKAAEETRKQLEKLQKQFGQAASELEKAAARAMPYDLDRSMSRELRTLTRQLRDKENKLAELQKKLQRMTNKQLADALSPLVDELRADSERYDKEVSKPLDDLAKAFPLIEDQMKFIALVQQQADLARRLESLKGHDQEDTPAIKARMRDLEEEQKDLRTELGQLLDDIDDHVKQLPDDKQFDKLRQTATKFVQEVRKSGAAEAMSEAESALAEFNGTRAHKQADKAAEILKQFMKSCSSMGQAGRGCLVFSPGLSQTLGNTIDQMLGQMGLQPGGTGEGSGGGYSARRNSLNNIGLYGNMPTEAGDSDAPKKEGGADGNGANPQEGAANPDRNPNATQDEQSAASSGAASQSVPAQYRRRVGQYFQRINEETPDH